MPLKSTTRRLPGKACWLVCAVAAWRWNANCQMKWMCFLPPSPRHIFERERASTDVHSVILVDIIHCYWCQLIARFPHDVFSIREQTFAGISNENVSEGESPVRCDIRQNWRSLWHLGTNSIFCSSVSQAKTVKYRNHSLNQSDT